MKEGYGRWIGEVKARGGNVENGKGEELECGREG
jgi:hypothetical protein